MHKEVSSQFYRGFFLQALAEKRDEGRGEWRKGEESPTVLISNESQ